MARRIATRTVVAVMFGVAALLGAALPATAATPAPAGVPAAKLAALQRDLGLSGAAVGARLASQADAAVTRSAMLGMLGGTFGGAWFDAATSRLVVATTDPAQRGAIRAAGARPVVVTQGLAALDAVKDSLDAHAGSVPDAVTGWYVDPASNSVVVAATDPAAARAFAAEAGVGPVRVERVTQRPRLMSDLVGGEAIYSEEQARCSVGFSATSGDAGYVITAGHCTDLGGTWSGADRTPIGPVTETSFPGNDYGLIRVDSPAWTLTSQFAGQGRQLTEITGSTEAPVGASVCRSGSTTGYQCGEIMAIDQSVNYANGDVVSGLTRTSACAERGDSGGPFVSGTQAQGVLSGGSGSCFLIFQGDTFFQPVNEILADTGLELLTSGS
ncbi:MAG: trypsin-like serine protease [Pseudonocardiaceae bacterium]|nr:trypsin-like serine protease [Pseudonocardiaceae bacterium]